MIRFMKKNGLQTDFTSQMSVYIFYGQVVFIIIHSIIIKGKYMG